MELYQKHAPKTCKNFYELARKGYYDGTVFHRCGSASGLLKGRGRRMEKGRK